MEREALSHLEEWKGRARRKPLVIRGARQVGKTWLMREFGRRSFSHVCYVNFERDPDAARLFRETVDPGKLISGLQIFCNVRISASDTLLVFDEVQEVPQVLTSLKYFCEEAGDQAILAAGSLLGTSLHSGAGFPVGKVEFLDLRPLDFLEYLSATGNGMLGDLLRKRDWKLATAFKDRFRELLRQYYFVGGMPEAVQCFLDENDFFRVRRIQQGILDSYEQDFSKHAPDDTVPRIRQVWQSIPGQLAKENRNFVYGAVRHGARGRDFDPAIQWLRDSGLVMQVGRVSRPSLPLPAYRTEEGFKLFLLDVGLLGAMSGLEAQALLHGSGIFTEFKGALTEQYVAQELQAAFQRTPCYWSAPRATAEVDFIVQHREAIYPLEVKAEENLKAKSLKVYSERYNPPIAFRTSMSDYRRESWIVNLPLYAISQLPEECAAFH